MQPDTEELKEFRLYIQDLYAARRDAKYDKVNATNSEDHEIACRELIEYDELIRKAKHKYKKMTQHETKKEVIKW